MTIPAHALRASLGRTVKAVQWLARTGHVSTEAPVRKIRLVVTAATALSASRVPTARRGTTNAAATPALMVWHVSNLLIVNINKDVGKAGSGTESILFIGFKKNRKHESHASSTVLSTFQGTFYREQLHRDWYTACSLFFILLMFKIKIFEWFWRWKLVLIVDCTQCWLHSVV